MKGYYIHVYHVKKGWAVRRSGALRVIAYYPERRDAIARAKGYLIRRGGGVYYVHRKDGRIGTRALVTEENNDA